MKLINIDEGKNTGLFFGHQAPQPCMVLPAIAPFLAGYLVYPTKGVHYSEYSPLTQHPPLCSCLIQLHSSSLVLLFLQTLSPSLSHFLL